jgi:uncharacterized membrane protein YcgQ (UPF0703/DUF1980 family)
MFIYNIKLDHKFIFKISFVIIFFIVIALAVFSIYKIFNYKNSSGCELNTGVTNISSSNYTNVLKNVHDNLDEHIGQKIHFIGYVYRVYDFTDTQFVLARNMLISTDNQTVVVGFLCNYKGAERF